MTGLPQTGWLEQRQRLSELAKRFDPASRLTSKDGWFWRVLARALPLATFGGLSTHAFLHEVATTLGPIQAYPSCWTAAAVERVLVHEARHTRQFRWFGLGVSPWLGLPLMALSYLLLPLPLGLAYVRYRLELDADRASWQHQLRQGATPERVRARALQFADRVASGAYGWSWPRELARRGFAHAAERVIAEHRR